MLTGCEQSSSPDRQLTLANQGLLSADLASDGKQAIVSSLSQGTVVWDLEQGKERWRWRQSDNPDNFIIITRFSADDSHAVTATPDSFGIWRLQDGQSQGYYSLPESRLRDIALSTDGRQVLIYREDGKAEVVDTRTYRRLQFLGHTEQVNTVDLSPTVPLRPHRRQRLQRLPVGYPLRPGSVALQPRRSGGAGPARPERTARLHRRQPAGQHLGSDNRQGAEPAAVRSPLRGLHRGAFCQRRQVAHHRRPSRQLSCGR